MRAMERYMSSGRARSRRGALLCQDWPASAVMFDALAARGVEDETLFAMIDRALKAHEAAFGLRDVERLMAVCKAMAESIDKHPETNGWVDRSLAPADRREALLRLLMPACYQWMIKA